MRMFIFFLIFIFVYLCFVSQVLCVCTDNRGCFGIINIFFFFIIIFFFFYLIIWWGIGIASESKLEVLKDGWFKSHNCFYHFSLSYFSIYFIIIATSYIWGNNSISQIYVGKDYKTSTNIGIPTHTRVCLEVNTHTGTLDYFINDKYIKDRVVNVPKDVYFEVWYFNIYLLLFIYVKIL
jgi:hypothetical protein